MHRNINRCPLLIHWPQVSFEKQLHFHLLVVFLLCLVRILLFVACNVATNFINYKRINFAIFLVTTVSSEYPLHVLCLCWEKRHEEPLPSDTILSLQDCLEVSHKAQPILFFLVHNHDRYQVRSGWVLVHSSFIFQAYLFLLGAMLYNFNYRTQRHRQADLSWVQG